MRWRQLKSVYCASTPESRARHEAAIREVEKDLPELMAAARRAFQALDEPTFSGQLRRALDASDLDAYEVAAKIEVRPEQLNDFMIGEFALPLHAIDRLVELLGYRLTKAG